MVLLKSRIAPLPKPCGKCGWFCLKCGQTWDCFEEGGCRGDRLIVCPACWKDDLQHRAKGGRDGR